MFVKVYKSFSNVKDIYYELSSKTYPYWSYESIASKMKTFKYIFQLPKVRWFVIYDKEKAILIAPLYIHKKAKLARVLGDTGYSTVDFIYNENDTKLLSSAFETLFKYLKTDIFNDSYQIKWWFILENSVSLSIIKELLNDNQLEIVTDDFVKNTIIPVGSDYSTYFGKLSKHVKQNVRTAYNRVRTDNFDVKFNFYENYINDQVQKNHVFNIFTSYMDVYCTRQNTRYKNGLRKIIKGLLIKWFHYDFKSAFYSFSFLADITINGKIAAMAKCYKYEHKKTLIIPMLAIDETMHRYSPGMILVNELAKLISTRADLNDISLGRGDEKYKYDMGGENYTTHKMLLRIK